jgi:hypothetical protein
MNRKLRDFEVGDLDETERMKLVRVLRRTRKRVEIMLAAMGAH